MKIVYVVRDYTNSGGMERVLLCKANYFVNLGHEVFIISNKTKSEPFFFCDPRIKMINIDVKDGKKNKKEYVKALTDCLLLIKPDIAISTGIGNSKYLFEVKESSKKILELHFSKYNRKYWFAKFDKYTLGRLISDLYTADKTHVAQKYDKFIVLTDEDKLSWRGLNNIEVISNPLFSFPSHYSDNTKKSVVTVGRFTYQKGYEYLIEVWKLVSKKHPDWKLVAYGNGNKKKYIEKIIIKKGLENVMELKAPTRSIFEELVKYSIYVMTSRYEGHPLSLLEAMSCGLPSVAFACKCGPRETISNGEDGFLVDFGDVQMCADKICSLIENEGLRQRMGQAGRVNMERFAMDKIMPKWIDLFDRLVKE